MNIPTVFFHIGNQSYFSDAIYIASRKNKVHVLGDQSTEYKSQFNNLNIVFHDIHKYNHIGNEFKKVYQHFHSGAVPEQLICYLRWFVIKAFMEENLMPCIFHADSDIAVLSDMSKTYQDRGCPYLGLMTMAHQPEHRLVASGCTSFWTYDALNNFCEYMIDSYKNPDKRKKLENKYKWHTENNISGGVCDMTQLYLFSTTAETHSMSKIFNSDNSCFDDNVNSSENYHADEYEMQYGIKKILSTKDSFYFVTKNNKSILAHTIHCQGVATKPFLSQIANYLRNKCE